MTGYMGWRGVAVVVWVIVSLSWSAFASEPEVKSPFSSRKMSFPEGSASQQIRPLAPDTSVKAQRPTDIISDTVSVNAGDSIGALLQDSVPVMISDSLGIFSLADSVATEPTRKSWRPSSFNPDPMRAVWLSALFPGLGQIYNRRYWKLPIVVGGYVGLFYATTWNSNMLSDYQRAYLDIMDSDPSTNSYMDFFAPSYREEDIDKDWLTSLLKQRKDYYRQYRDLCIICMIGLYAVCMIDAYVDAQLYHFDVSPDISMQWQPAVIPTGRSMLPAVGLQCAITF